MENFHGFAWKFSKFSKLLVSWFFSFILVNLSILMKNSRNLTNLKKKIRKKWFCKFGKFPWLCMDIFQIFQIACFLIFFIYFCQSQSILMKNSQNFTNLKKKLRKAILKIWKISMAWNGNTRRMEIFQIFQIFQIACFLILFFYFGQYQSILMRNSRNFTNLKKKTQKKAILKIWKMSMVSHGNFPNFPNHLFLDCFFYFGQSQSILMKNSRNFYKFKEKKSEKSDFEKLEYFHGFTWKFSKFCKFSKSLVSWFFSFILVNLSILMKNSWNFTNLKKKLRKKGILKIWNISLVSHGNFQNFHNFPYRLFLDFFLLFWSICLTWWKIVEILQI